MLNFGNSKYEIFKDRDNQGFLKSSEFYASYILDIEYRLKAIKTNFIYQGKTIELGVGVFSRLRLSTEDRYLNDFEKQFAQNPHARPKKLSGLDQYGGLGFIGYQFRLLDAFWIEFDLAFRFFLDGFATVDRSLNIRAKVKYMLNWRAYAPAVKLSKTAILLHY